MIRALAILLLSISIPIHQSAPVASLVQPPSYPHNLTLYNPKGEQVITCQIVDNGDTIKDCKIRDGFTLDDVMTSWADAYKDLEGKK